MLVYILFLLTSARNLTYLLQNCRTDCRHFRHVGGLWSNDQHGLCEIAPDGQVWEFWASVLLLNSPCEELLSTLIDI